MKIKIVLLIFLVANSIKVIAQSTTTLEVANGLELGTWRVTHDEPFRSTNSLVNHSDTKLSVPISVAFYLSKNRFQTGIEIKNQYIAIQELLPSRSPGDYEQVTNSRGVNFTTLLLSLRYSIITKENYSLIPTIGLGTFLENSIHEEKSEFSNRRSLKIAFQNKLRKNDINYFITPQVLINTLIERQVLKHSVISYGIEIGLVISLKQD